MLVCTKISYKNEFKLIDRRKQSKNAALNFQYYENIEGLKSTINQIKNLAQAVPTSRKSFCLCEMGKKFFCVANSFNIPSVYLELT